ncbi:MAG TPA: leucyl aminopeptidase [Anaerolineae bacterium]|nr:leucyl aminopeptidase [Anaerolineae bacterium]
MEIQVVAGGIQSTEDELIVVNLFEGVERPVGATGAVDQALGGAIREIIADGDFRGKRGEIALFYPRGALPATRVLVVGLGAQDAFTLQTIREASAAVACKARDLGVPSFSSIVHGSGAGGFPLEEAAQAVVEGTILGLYRYQELKNEDPDRPDLERFTLVQFDEAKVPAIEAGALMGQIVAEATCLARDLVNRPANYATPSDLAELALEIAGEFDTMRCQILSEEDAEELKMGSFLGVARGSDEPAAFIVMEYNPGREDLDTVVLVGKGITFDTGGISLKPSERMDRMRGDMGGGAAVLATMLAVGQCELPLHVVGLVPATENMPGGSAYKPGDVLEAMNGKTIEVLNTDAEGRLILADALAYANRFEPKAVIDLATLTGACVVALGRGMAAGLFCEDESLRARLQAASTSSGERLWHMPLFDEYLDSLQSLSADIANVGGDRFTGVGVSAMFLKQFAEGYPWAHVDIAGMSFEERPPSPKRPAHLQKGGTGFGVRLLVQFLRDWAATTGVSAD